MVGPAPFQLVPGKGQSPRFQNPGRGSGGAHPRDAPARILVVEDNYFVGLAVESALAEAGYEVLAVVATGEEAVAIGLAAHPELVVMDIRLAGEMSGIEAAVELRQHGITSLFATAHSDAAIRTAGAQAVPAGWITKPFSDSELTSTVAAALAKIRAN